MRHNAIAQQGLLLKTAGHQNIVVDRESEHPEFAFMGVPASDGLPNCAPTKDCWLSYTPTAEFGGRCLNSAFSHTVFDLRIVAVALLSRKVSVGWPRVRGILPVRWLSDRFLITNNGATISSFFF